MSPRSAAILALLLALSPSCCARRVSAARLDAEGDSLNEEDSFLEEDSGAEDGTQETPKPKFNMERFKVLAPAIYSSSSDGTGCGDALTVTAELDAEKLRAVMEAGLDKYLRIINKKQAWELSAAARSVTSSKQIEKQKPLWSTPDAPGDYITITPRTLVNDKLKRVSEGKTLKLHTKIHITDFYFTKDRIRAYIDQPQEGYISLRSLETGGRWAVSTADYGPKLTSTSLFEKLTGVSEGLRLFSAQIDDLHMQGPFGEDSTLIPTLQQALEEGDPVVQLTFIAGVDLRNCWGDLSGLDDDEEVCSDNIMQALKAELDAKKKVKENKAGNSGSSIVVLGKFVIKSAADGLEYSTLPDVGRQISRGIAHQHDRLGGCWSTGLTPICGALIEPGNGYWLVTRNIDVQGVSDHPLQNNGYAVDYFDIKSPYFVGLVDGKTHLNKVGMFGDDPNVWKNKDPGFCDQFPEGVPISNCGARDATATLIEDSDMLKNLKMTDYSLFVKLKGPVDRCSCDTSTKPYFPILLHAPPQTWGVEHTRTIGEGMTFAVAIIDYLERNTNPLPMSTMKEPPEFQDYWMRIMSSYFRIPGRMISNNQITSTRHEPAEKLLVGAEVFSLQRVKFRGVIADDNTVWSDHIAKVQGESAKEYYFEQAPEIAACVPVTKQGVWGVNPMGLNVYWTSVPPGSKGRVISIAAKSVAVHFDDKMARATAKAVFNMQPGQIMKFGRDFA